MVDHVDPEQLPLEGLTCNLPQDAPRWSLPSGSDSSTVFYHRSFQNVRWIFVEDFQQEEVE